MTADRWTQAVRQQLGLGRILPLGGPRDGAWIAEAAAGTVLRRAADALPGVRMAALRIALADPDDTREPAVPPPPSALPPGPLRITAEFAAAVSEPLPTAAARLRAALTAAAAERLGLTVTDVDLRVTALLEGDEGEPESVAVRPGEPERRVPVGEAEENLVATAALMVPGVTHVGGVHVEVREEPAALPHRHVRVDVTVAEEHRALDVARGVRASVAEALPEHPTVAVLVTAVG